MRRFARLLRETAERHGVGAQLRVPSFGLDASDIPELEGAVAAAREEGVEDLWTWGYEGCRHMTHLATPDAPAVWEAVTAALTARPQVSQENATVPAGVADSDGGLAAVHEAASPPPERKA